MVNIWKISTLALAGALAIVVGQGSVRETEACETDISFEEEQTQVRLTAALGMLDRADAQIRAATAARRKPRAAALEQIALAKANVKRSLAPEPEPAPRPLPRKKVTAADKTVSVAVFASP